MKAGRLASGIMRGVRKRTAKTAKKIAQIIKAVRRPRTGLADQKIEIVA